MRCFVEFEFFGYQRKSRIESFGLFAKGIPTSLYMIHRRSVVEFRMKVINDRRINYILLNIYIYIFSKYIAQLAPLIDNILHLLQR